LKLLDRWSKEGLSGVFRGSLGILQTVLSKEFNVKFFLFYATKEIFSKIKLIIE